MSEGTDDSSKTMSDSSSSSKDDGDKKDPPESSTHQQPEQKIAAKLNDEDFWQCLVDSVYSTENFNLSDDLMQSVLNKLIQWLVFFLSSFNLLYF
jgi:hypothetical protein